jgi:sugar phosphate isomerase/epimerase
MSPWTRVNLDIGQFMAAGLDPAPFIEEHHRNIPMIHVRDGKPGVGTKLPWGMGMTPIGEVLRPAPAADPKRLIELTSALTI